VKKSKSFGPACPARFRKHGFEGANIVCDGEAISVLPQC
jgi:hypothetical protein